MGKRKGSRNYVLIAKLTREANEHHREVKRHCQGLLKHACRCGDVLSNIRWKTANWKVEGWKSWCNSHLDFSYETAKVYMRISSTWGNPEMKEAREKGGITSIAAYIKILSELRASKDKPMEPIRQLASMRRQYLRKQVTDWLSNKSPEESEVLESNIDCYLGIWDEKLYDDTSAYLDGDLDEHLFWKVKEKLEEWERKNQKKRNPWWNPPKWVIDAHMRQNRVEERKRAKYEARRKCIKAVNKSA
ncbi:MAG: hypothetical protein FVQ85_20985 [Planctomycetes bacterium]|nr:hypothetical protein [Planctomycetota bacterium]